MKCGLNKEKSSCKVRSQYNSLSIICCSHTLSGTLTSNQIYKYTSYQIIIRTGLCIIGWCLLKTRLDCSLVFSCNFEEERNKVNVQNRPLFLFFVLSHLILVFEKVESLILCGMPSLWLPLLAAKSVYVCVFSHV